MSRNKEVEWIGHVHYPNGDVREVAVFAPSGNKFAAMGKVQTAVGVTSPNDPSINGITLQEIGKLKVYKSGRSLSKEAGMPASMPEKTDPKFKRYRVQMYPSPASASYRVCSLSAANPYDALTGAMARFSVKLVEETGPYIVEEENRDGFEVRLAKQANVFGTSYLPGATPPKRTPINQRNNPVRAPATKQAVHQSVAELFRMEKKVTPNTYTVVKG